MRVLCSGQTEIWRCWLLWREKKTGEPEENTRSEELERTNKLTHVTQGRNQTRAILVGGGRSHHCANPLLPGFGVFYQ